MLLALGIVQRFCHIILDLCFIKRICFWSSWPFSFVVVMVQLSRQSSTTELTSGIKDRVREKKKKDKKKVKFMGWDHNSLLEQKNNGCLTTLPVLQFRRSQDISLATWGHLSCFCLLPGPPARPASLLAGQCEMLKNPWLCVSAALK